MLYLPKTTELLKPLPKKAIYERFGMNAAAKEKIDADISKITIVNEISEGTVNIPSGSEVTSIFVLLVTLKRENFSGKTIELLSKMIPQNILFILEYDGESKLAVYRTRLIQSDWKSSDEQKIEISGRNMDSVWENLIKSLECGVWNEELTLDENLAFHEKQAKLEKEIARLEKRARAEKQPRKKFELVQRIKEIKSNVVIKEKI